ncbi:gamma-glutamylcyclotransferase, partial [Verminephrobacter eiseniae]
MRASIPRTRADFHAAQGVLLVVRHAPPAPVAGQPAQVAGNPAEGVEILLVSRHRSSVGLRWPSKRIAALHRLPIQLGMGCAMRLALRSD